MKQSLHLVLGFSLVGLRYIFRQSVVIYKARFFGLEQRVFEFDRPSYLFETIAFNCGNISQHETQAAQLSVVPVAPTSSLPVTRSRKALRKARVFET